MIDAVSPHKLVHGAVVVVAAAAAAATLSLLLFLVGRHLDAINRDRTKKMSEKKRAKLHAKVGAVAHMLTLFGSSSPRHFMYVNGEICT